MWFSSCESGLFNSRMNRVRYLFGVVNIVIMSVIVKRMMVVRLLMMLVCRIVGGVVVSLGYCCR